MCGCVRHPLEAIRRVIRRVLRVTLSRDSTTWQLGRHQRGYSGKFSALYGHGAALQLRKVLCNWTNTQ